MNNHNDSSVVSVRSSLLCLPTPAPAAPTLAAQVTLTALFAVPAFVDALRGMLRRRVLERDRSELLANVQRLALSSSSVPEELEACKAWVATLVRRQADNYRWHGGLPLAPPRLTVQLRDPEALSMRDQLQAEYDEALGYDD